MDHLLYDQDPFFDQIFRDHIGVYTNVDVITHLIREEFGTSSLLQIRITESAVEVSLDRVDVTAI